MGVLKVKTTEGWMEFGTSGPQGAPGPIGPQGPPGEPPKFTRYGFSYRKNTANIVPSTDWTTIPVGDKKLYDEQSAYNPVTGVWTAPINGIFHFEATVLGTVTATSGEFQITIALWSCNAAGTPIAEVIRGTGVSLAASAITLNKSHSVSLSGDHIVTAGETYCLRLYFYSGGAARSIQGPSDWLTRFSGYYMTEFAIPTVITPPNICILQKLDVQAIPAVVWTAVNFNYEELDSTGNMHDTTTTPSRVYIRRSGVYTLSATSFSDMGTGNKYLRFTRNGVAISGRMWLTTNVSTEMFYTRSVYLNVGDYVELNFYSISAVSVYGAVLNGENQTTFSVVEQAPPTTAQQIPMAIEPIAWTYNSVAAEDYGGGYAPFTIVKQGSIVTLNGVMRTKSAIAANSTIIGTMAQAGRPTRGTATLSAMSSFTSHRLNLRTDGVLLQMQPSSGLASGVDIEINGSYVI